MRSPSPNPNTKCCQGPLRRCKRTRTSQDFSSRCTWFSRCHIRHSKQMMTTSRLYQELRSSKGSRFDHHRCISTRLIATGCCTSPTESSLPRQCSHVRCLRPEYYYCMHTLVVRPSCTMDFRSPHRYSSMRTNLRLLVCRVYRRHQLFTWQHLSTCRLDSSVTV